MGMFLELLNGGGAPATTSAGQVSRQLSRHLAVLDEKTTLRINGVHANAAVQAAKLQQVDRLAREAMHGQVLLQRLGQALANGDPWVAEEAQFFAGIAKLGKGEILMQTVTAYADENRRNV